MMLSDEMTEGIGRALGALRGLSLGDALGMPTQSMDHAWITSAYGKVTDLVDAIDDEPIAPGMPAGSVTDDTEQALIVARLIAEGKGHIDSYALASRLLEWEDDMKARGSLDLLGPSTKFALKQVRSGADISTTGRTGTTNGSAMRVAPVGIAHSAQDPMFADYVYESCRVTHNTVQGFQSALLVASAVSFGIDGFSVRDALEEAINLTGRTPVRGSWSPRASVLARVRLAIELAAISANTDPDDKMFADRLRNEVGTSVEANESIAAAFALVYRYSEHPLQALLTAVNMGGDTDTIAAISGAILGACGGAATFPERMTKKVSDVSHLDLSASAQSLMEIRHQTDAGPFQHRDQ
jgi:ADP-ribosylglycohydrolase